MNGIKQLTRLFASLAIILGLYNVLTLSPSLGFIMGGLGIIFGGSSLVLTFTKYYKDDE